MRHRHSALHDCAPTSVGMYAVQPGLAGDQWVSTEHEGAWATGRVVAMRRGEDGVVLYEIELPLRSSHRGMTRVLRSTSQMRPLGGSY